MSMQPRRTRRGFCFYGLFKTRWTDSGGHPGRDNADVLMVGFMNEEALAITRRTGYATFFSRTRNTCGRRRNLETARVVDILVDCDDDTCWSR